MIPMSRRDLLTASAALMGATVLGSQPGIADADEPKRSETGKLKIVVVGAHPDDPETGCGGTIARYADAGHDVTVLYLTHGKPPEEAGRIRTAECQQACKVLHAVPRFVGQNDDDTEVNRARYDEFVGIIQAEKPNLVFTHWPVDSHRDHRAAASLAYEAWFSLGKSFPLYYYEVYTGIQTQLFAPTDYVDITATEARKRASVMAHASQKPLIMYKLHDLMNQFRGKEFGCQYAEAFIRHAQGPVGWLPPRSDVV
jgi:N-acetylglucosamine malate deacetylase 1